MCRVLATLLLWNLLGTIGRWTRVSPFFGKHFSFSGVFLCETNLSIRILIWRSPDAIVICNGVSSSRNALRKRRSWNCRTKHRPLNWTKNGGWMEIRGASKTTPFFLMFFEGPTLYTMIFTEQTFGLYQLDKHMSFRHAGFFLVVAELSRWNLSLFLIKIYFSWNSSNAPFGNFRSTLESLLGNLVPKRCMPMQTSPPMVPARLEREVINPDPSLALFFFVTSRDCCHSPCMTL